MRVILRLPAFRECFGGGAMETESDLKAPDVCQHANSAEQSKGARAFISNPIRSLLGFLAIAGPGVTVMLADTDAGSVITAAQSGARWGYKLLLLQIILVPILYIVQELTVRLGATTGKGHGELIRAHFGTGWAFVSVSTLFVAAVGALITEFSGIAGAGLLFGVAPWKSVGLAVAFLLVVIFTGSYRRVELAAIAVGLFELAFIPAALLSRPDAGAIVQGLAGAQPLGDPDYLSLVAANVGAVIMPWMIFYQQAAVVEKGLRPEHLRMARWDTLVGSVATQIIMGAVLVTTAATIGKTEPGAPLHTVQEIANALRPMTGELGGKILFSVGVTGAALIAAIVVSLAAAWAFGELFGFPSSLNLTPRKAPLFYGVYTAGILGAAGLVLSGLPLVKLAISVEVMNALLLPLVLGFLIALAFRVLPEGYRLSRVEKVAVIVISGLVMLLGVAVTLQLLL